MGIVLGAGAQSSLVIYRHLETSATGRLVETGKNKC